MLAPIQLGMTAYRQRARALGGERTAAPLFWLAVGLFVGCIRCELHNFVYGAAVTTGGLADLAPSQMNAFVWIVTLACPCMLFMSTYAYLRHHAPGPSRVLSARAPMLALAASGVVGIGAVFLAGRVAVRAEQLSNELLLLRAQAGCSPGSWCLLSCRSWSARWCSASVTRRGWSTQTEPKSLQ